MLYWALVFLVVAIIAAVFGFAGVRHCRCGYRQIVVLHFSGDFCDYPDYGLDEERRRWRFKQSSSIP